MYHLIPWLSHVTQLPTSSRRHSNPTSIAPEAHTRMPDSQMKRDSRTPEPEQKRHSTLPKPGLALMHSIYKFVIEAGEVKGPMIVFVQATMDGVQFCTKMEQANEHKLVVKLCGNTGKGVRAGFSCAEEVSDNDKMCVHCGLHSLIKNCAFSSRNVERALIFVILPRTREALISLNSEPRARQLNIHSKTAHPLWNSISKDLGRQSAIRIAVLTTTLCPFSADTYSLTDIHALILVYGAKTMQDVVYTWW